MSNENNAVMNASELDLDNMSFDRDFSGGNTKNNYCIIYLLINKINKMKYVGQSWYPLQIRMGKDARNYKNSIYLYNAIKFYGIENFEYQVITHTLTQEGADLAEAHFIKQHDTMNNEVGYNIKAGGSAGCHSEETKAKMSKTFSEKIGNLSEEELKHYIRGIAGYWTGKERGPHTDEWKKNNSAMMIKRHAEQGHPMQGKHHTEETKKKISEAGMGRIMPREGAVRGGIKRRMSKEREKEIIEAYLQNETFISMCKKFKTNPSSIYRVLERNGIEK